MNTKLLILLVVSALVSLSSSPVRACDSPSTEGTLGPMFGVAGTSSDEMPLLMATSNASIIGGHVVSIHKVDDDNLVSKAFNVTIDLASGAVSDGRPVERTIVEPQTMGDPTLGYRLELRDTTVTLRSSTNSSHRAVDIELYAPSYAMVATHFLYFFVSAKLNRAYVFYVSEIDCSLPNGYTPCEQSPRGIFEEFWVSIVDVYTGRYFFQPFGRGFGVFLLDPGPHGSLQTVYDDIQVAMVSSNLAGRGCERSSYVFYDENTVVPTERFGRGLLAALQTNNRPRELSVFVIKQTTEELGRREEGDLVEEFVSEFVVSEVLVITGEVVRQIPLNAGDLYSLAGFDLPPSLGIVAVDSPAPATTIVLPTREPNSILEPTRAPVVAEGPPATAFFPTLSPAAFFPTLSPAAKKPTIQAPFTLPPLTVPTTMIVGGEELVPTHPTLFAAPFMWLPTIPIGGGNAPSAPQQPWIQSSNGNTGWTSATVTSSEPTTVAPSTIAPTTMKPSTALPTTISPTTVAPSTSEPSTLQPITTAPTTTKPTADPTKGGTQPPLPEGFSLLTAPPTENVGNWNLVPHKQQSTPPTLTPVSVPEQVVPIPDGFLLLTPETIEVAAGMQRTPYPAPTNTPKSVPEQTVPIPDGFLLLTPAPTGDAADLERTSSPTPKTPDDSRKPSSPPVFVSGLLFHLTAKPVGGPASSNQLLRGQPTGVPAATTINSLAGGQAQPMSSPADLVTEVDTQPPTTASVILQPTYDLVIAAEETTADSVLSPTRDPGIAAEHVTSAPEADEQPTSPTTDPVDQTQPLTPQPTASPNDLTIKTTNKEADTSEEFPAAAEPDTASSSWKRFSCSILLAITILVVHVAF